MVARLYEVGVDTAFAILGDVILRLCQVIDEDPRITFRTLSHEPGITGASPRSSW